MSTKPREEPHNLMCQTLSWQCSNLASAFLGSLKERVASGAEAAPLAAITVTTLKSVPILLVARTRSGESLSSNVSFPNNPKRAKALNMGFWGLENA